MVNYVFVWPIYLLVHGFYIHWPNLHYIMKQHYLPECYLKEFCTAGKLYAIDIYPFRKRKKAVFFETKTPAQVARSKDFYTIQPEFGSAFKELEGRGAYELETHFHRYENGKYSKVITKLKAGQQALPMADAILLGYAIVDFKLRNNYFKDHAVKTAQQNTLKSVMDEYANFLHKKQFAHPASLNEANLKVEEIKKAFQIDPDSLQSTHVWSQVVRKDEGNTLHLMIFEILSNYQWTIYQCKNGFITSDNPGCSLDANGIVQNTKYDKEVIVFMPLTHSSCLVIDYKVVDTNIKKNKAQKKIHLRKG